MDLPLRNYLVKKARGYTQLLNVSGKGQLQFKRMDEETDTRVFENVGGPVSPQELAAMINVEQTTKQAIIAAYNERLAVANQMIADATASRDALTATHTASLSEVNQKINDLQAIRADVQAL